MSDAPSELDPQQHGPSPDLRTALFVLDHTLHPQSDRIANEVWITDWEKSATRLDGYRATQRVIILSVTLPLRAALAVSGARHCKKDIPYLCDHYYPAREKSAGKGTGLGPAVTQE